jgi:hypothetical protein
LKTQLSVVCELRSFYLKWQWIDASLLSKDLKDKFLELMVKRYELFEK